MTMPRTQLTQCLAGGYPELLAQDKWISDPIEPGLSLPVLLLLRSEGFALDYPFVDVVSGHATQFLYSLDHPECVELAFEPPVETLFKALNLTWQEMTPSDAHTAYLVLAQWISESGRPVLARFCEPMLIFGVSTQGLEQQVHLVRSMPELKPERVRILDIELSYWRQPLDEGNVLVRIIEKRANGFSELELTKRAARNAVRHWHAGELAGCAAGEKAYFAFMNDLRDTDVDFCGRRALAWACSPIYQQWTARYSSFRFFERMAPRFGGQARGALEKAAFYYQQCCEAWHKWDLQLGRPWKWWIHPKLEDEPQLQTFYSRWQDRKRREAAAACVEDAMHWERKAISELTKVST
jgi:hypothetical protein